MADDRLDGGSALHLAADRLGDAADLAADPDPELVRMVMAAIALVDVDAAGLRPGQVLHTRAHPGEGGGCPRAVRLRLGLSRGMAHLRLSALGIEPPHSSGLGEHSRAGRYR